MARHLTPNERDCIVQCLNQGADQQGDRPKAWATPFHDRPGDRPQRHGRRIPRRGGTAAGRAAAAGTALAAEDGRSSGQPGRTLRSRSAVVAGANCRTAAAQRCATSGFAANDLRVDQTRPAPQALGIVSSSPRKAALPAENRRVRLPHRGPAGNHRAAIAARRFRGRHAARAAADRRVGDAGGPQVAVHDPRQNPLERRRPCA